VVGAAGSAGSVTAAMATQDAPIGSSGVLLGLGSAAAFGTSGALAKGLLDQGWSPGAAVTARICLAGLLLAVPAFRALDGRWHLVRANAPMILLFGLLAVGGVQLFYFTAVQTLSVGVALLLEYLGVILVVGWLWAVHGQRPRRLTVLGVVLAVAGLVLVLDVTGGMQIDLGGVLWGLAAAVGLATYFVLSARVDTGLPAVVMAAGGMTVATVTLAAAGLIGALPMRATAEDVSLGGATLAWWVPVVALGVVAGAVAYASGIAATRRLGSKVAAFLGLTEVLFAILVAWLLLDELPMPVQLAGGALIIGGVAAVRYEELARARALGIEPVPG
jgi:drug/metabolite transporter (DMT)-like permease